MADKDYNYVVEAQDLQPYVAAKENLDSTRLVYDFSCYLDPGEGIGQITRATVGVVPTGVTPSNWRQDYPPGTLLGGTPGPDTYPLVVASEALANNTSNVEIWVNAGTPLYTYVLSFVIISSGSQRQKQVDTLITIEQPLNPLMVGPGTVVTTPGQVIVVGGSTNLPAGFDGLILFENASNLSNVIITLPPAPLTMGQTVEFIDVLGKDGACPVTFKADSGAAIDGDGSLSFVSFINFDCLRWRWTGTNWHLMASRFNFLA